jgi:hypothetical protein
MHYAGIFLLAALLSQQAIAAELSPQEQCSKLGDIAQQASQMRLDGKDMNAAMETLQKADNAGIADDKVSGAVRVSYMAKMKPDDMRNYYISECNKDILR